MKPYPEVAYCITNETNGRNDRDDSKKEWDNRI